MRTTVEVIVSGLRLRGTGHIPPTAAGYPPGFAGLGVVIYNSGALARSGQGSFATDLADSIAGKGVTTVRLDLPGLGDSEGDLPDNALTFFQQVQSGNFGQVALEAACQLKTKLGLKRLILGGHCGGATTAFFASTLKPHSVAGLIALEPTFCMVLPVHAPGSANSVAENPSTVECGHPVVQCLPPNTNLPLFRCVGRVMDTRIPLLIVTASSEQKQPGFDYLRFLSAQHSGPVVHRDVSGTDHAFIAGDGKMEVIKTVTGWLIDTFGSEALEKSDSVLNRTPEIGRIP